MCVTFGAKKNSGSSGGMEKWYTSLTEAGYQDIDKQVDIYKALGLGDVCEKQPWTKSLWAAFEPLSGMTAAAHNITKIVLR